MKITISKENYLKTIAEAESEGEAVIAATLARWLKVSAPAVTMAIRRLKRDELIRVGREGQITLTRSGRTIANRLLNRHHLIERMLTEPDLMTSLRTKAAEHIARHAPARIAQNYLAVISQALSR